MLRGKDGNTLYVIVLDRPTQGGVPVTKLADVYPHLNRDIREVSLLGTPGRIEWKRDHDGLHLTFPNNANGQHAWCYKLDLAPGQPE